MNDMIIKYKLASPHVLDGDRGLGKVSRQHNLPLAGFWRPKNQSLSLHVQPRMEGDELGIVSKAEQIVFAVRIKSVPRNKTVEFDWQ